MPARVEITPDPKSTEYREWPHRCHNPSSASRTPGVTRNCPTPSRCGGAARANALLLFTGLSPSAHAASSPEDPGEGWWQGMVGPGLAIDTDERFVVCVNSLGSCFGSTGPASNDPATGRPYRVAFPDLSVEDIARAGYEVVRSLGILRVDTVMGP